MRLDVREYRRALTFNTDAGPDELPEAMRAMLLHEAMRRKLDDFAFVNMSRVVLDPPPEKGLSFTFHFQPLDGVVLCGIGGFRRAPVCDWLREPITGKALSQQFDQIECQVDADNPSIKTGPCKRGKPRPKLFYRRARSLHDYARKLQEGSIPSADHEDIFAIVSGWKSFENHNMDIPLLHFK